MRSPSGSPTLLALIALAACALIALWFLLRERPESVPVPTLSALESTSTERSVLVRSPEGVRESAEHPTAVFAPTSRSSAVATVTGAVRWPDGVPAPGEVQVFALSGSAAGGRQLPNLETGPEGTFRLEHLEPGPYLVVARQVHREAQHELGGIGQDGWWQALREFRVPGAGQLELVLAPQCSIRARAAGLGGIAVEQFDVHVRPRRAAGEREDGREAFSWDFTTADGTFEFVGCFPGEWDVEVDAPGFLSQWRRGVVLPSRDRLEFELVPAVELQGEVVDAAGQPLSCTVWARWESSHAGIGAGRASAKSASNGSFLVTRVAATTVRLQASADGVESDRLLLDLLPGQPRDRLKLVLPRK
jgi:hypothetical protein